MAETESEQPNVKDRLVAKFLGHPRKDKPLPRRQETRPADNELFPGAQVHHGVRYNGKPFKYYTQSAVEDSSQGWVKFMQKQGKQTPAVINKSKVLAWTDISQVSHPELAKAAGYEIDDPDAVRIVFNPSAYEDNITVFLVDPPEEKVEGALAAVEYFARSLGDKAKNIGLNYAVLKKLDPDDPDPYDGRSYVGPLSDFKDPWPDL